jgi:two-component system cell cycle response regulator
MQDMDGGARMVKPFEGSIGKLTLSPITLIVDDETDYGRAMQDALTAYGFEVHLAHSATEALHMMRALTPDVILLDIMMPEVDGLMLLRMLRTDPARAHIPVVVISARVAEEDRQEAIAAGANLFLEKPFTSQQLEGALSGYVELNHRTADWANRTAVPPRTIRIRH